MSNTVLITKANGVMEPFDVNKLKSSLLRSGATIDQANNVLDKVVNKIKPGDTTSRIYRHAFSVLKKMESGVAARYSLRRSLAELGPSGFPFEIFISKLFQAQGYKTAVGAHLRGKCIEHEVDLLAWDSESLVVGEVKFHNNSDLKNDSKTALYVQARFQDLQRSNFDGMNPDNLDAEGWLITNTKFTQTTVNYAKCNGMKLLGWNYPYNTNSLQGLIESSGLEPVTALTTLNQEDKRSLMKQDIVLCRDLLDSHKLLSSLGMSKRKINQVMGELYHLTNTRNASNSEDVAVE